MHVYQLLPDSKLADYLSPFFETAITNVQLFSRYLFREDLSLYNYPVVKMRSNLKDKVYLVLIIKFSDFR